MGRKGVDDVEGAEWNKDVFVHSKIFIFKEDLVLNAATMAQVSSGEEGVDDVEGAERNEDVSVHSRTSIVKKDSVLNATAMA